MEIKKCENMVSGVHTLCNIIILAFVAWPHTSLFLFVGFSPSPAFGMEEILLLFFKKDKKLFKVYIYDYNAYSLSDRFIPLIYHRLTDMVKV